MFKNKIVLITGGTSGIGLATAIEFAKAGAAHIIVIGRTRDKWVTAEKTIRVVLPVKKHKIIEYWPCDVRVEDEIHGVIHDIFAQFKRLDVCVNNAGVQPVNDGDLTKMEFESFIDKEGSLIFKLPGFAGSKCSSYQKTPVSQFCENPIATSVFGMFFSLKWELHYIYEYQPTHLPVSIINISSRNGIMPDPHRPLYAAAKAFIISITRSMATQVSRGEQAQNYHRENIPIIRINSISPGPIDTPLEKAAFSGSSYEEYEQKAAKGVPMKRTGKPEDIAKAILFLANDELSNYMTGSNMVIDGGYLGSPII
jgi:NAD(P)-dependent dehydrogenase (short-subunit alcohol dehydrogenase family)